MAAAGGSKRSPWWLHPWVGAARHGAAQRSAAQRCGGGGGAARRCAVLRCAALCCPALASGAMSGEGGRVGADLNSRRTAPALVVRNVPGKHWFPTPRGTVALSADGGDVGTFCCAV
eukprot:gene17727-biopygen6852